MRTSLPRFLLAASLVAGLPAAVLVATRPAHAEIDDARIVLRVEGTLPVTAEELRKAVAAELGVEVALEAPGVTGRATVTVKVEGDKAKVSFTTGGRTVDRPVTLPKSGAQSLEVVVLIVGNLARDEAGELLAELHVKVTVGASASASASASAPAPAESASAPSPEPVPTPPPTPAPAKTAKAETKGAKHHCTFKGSVFGADFLPGVGSSTSEDGRNAVRIASFNALGGVAHGLTGVEIGGVFNLETGFVCGAQIAGAVNVVAGDVHGVQIGGAVNVVGGDVHGVQLAGAFGLGADVSGAQVAGGYAHARDVEGLQLGGGVALARHFVGGQVTGGFAFARTLQGFQFGSFVVAGDVAGAQLGAVNAAVSLRGVQLGSVNWVGNATGVQVGAVNIASGYVHGVQFGTVNVADDVDVPIGLVSIVRKGRTTFDLWVHESGYTALGIVHGGRRVHNIFGLAAQPSYDGSTALPGLVYGLGVRAKADEHFTIDVDAIVTTFLRVRDTFEKTTEFFTTLSELRVAFGVPVFEHASVVFGPTLRLLVTTDPETKPVGPISGVQLHDGRTTTTYSSGTGLWMIPGAFVGIRI